MSMDDETAEALRTWKEHRYRPTDLPLADAVDSLVLEEPLIYARQSDTRKSDWVICRTGTTTPATFVFAGVFAEGDPYETGNLVPPKGPVPAGLDDNRVARHAGYKAAYSYAIDTFHDKDMWELQQALDAYMVNVPGFNSRGVKRRDWQNGSTWHLRYWFRVPMFLTCETRGGRPDAPAGLHEWVVNAHKKTKNYRANPVRPQVCGLEGGRLQSIAQCTPNVLEYGDVVSVVFGLVYVEGGEDWGPVPMVTHVIRVRRANREAYPLTSSVIVEDVQVDDGSLCVGAVVDAEEAAAADAAKEKAAAKATKAKIAAAAVAAKMASAKTKASVVAAATKSSVDAGPAERASDADGDEEADSVNALSGVGTGTVTAEEVANQEMALVTGGPPEPRGAVQEDATMAAGTLIVVPIAEVAPADVRGSVHEEASTQDGMAADDVHEQSGDDHSGSEMDVDDDGGALGPIAGSSTSMPSEDDDDGNSSCSTLAEDARGASDNLGSSHVPSKRRRRAAGDSDSDNVGRGRGARGNRGARGRRGLRGGR